MSDNISRIEQWLATLQPFEVNQPNLRSQLASLMLLSIMQSHNFNPLDIIFSCHVCGETLDSIYSEPDDGKGLRLMLGAENGAVVKLVLTECSHLTCVKHLEGGIPFHPVDQVPRAPCPICNQEDDDVMPKRLYAVHGLRDEEFDPQFPEGDLEFTPPGLELGNPNMRKLKYQFVALWRYGAKLFNRRNEANLEMNKLQDRLNQLERKTAGMAALTAPEQSEKDKLAIMMMNLRQEHGELMERMEFLEKEINEVQPMIDQWDNWKTRQTEITAYLNFLAPLARAHLLMREKLWELGLYIQDTEDVEKVFGPQSVRSPGPHRFRPDPSANNVAAGGSGGTAIGNVTLPSPAPFASGPSSQRLTLPPPPTTTRTHGTTPAPRGGPGLSANVRTSAAPVVYGPPPTSPPRRPLPPLPVTFGTGAMSRFFTTPTTPRRDPPFLADPRLPSADDEEGPSGR